MVFQNIKSAPMEVSQKKGKKELVKSRGRQ